MKRKLLLLIFTFFSFFGCVNITHALTGTVTATSGLYIRKGPASTYDDILTLSYNDKVTIASSTPTKTEDNTCTDGWYKVTYNSKTGYACSTWISISNTTTDAGTYYTTSGYEARITDYSYNYVRKTKSTSGNVAATLMFGEAVNIKGTYEPGGGCSKNWYKVSFRNNQTGYICGSELTFYKDAADIDFDEKDQAYCNELKAAGFPESYCPYLVKLHNSHPTWTFEPVITGLKWASVVKGESNKNYFSIMFDEPSFRKSDTKKDGGAWYVAKDSINAFYLDPRNFLYEDTIFMFESLKFNEQTDTIENIKAILKGTDLETDTYAKYFVEAGKKYNVSATHTSSRVVQEGTADLSLEGTSGLSTYKYRSRALKGYYNFFNIGAYQDDYTTIPVARGLAYACGALNGLGELQKCGYFTAYGRPWDTRKKAIYGGTEWIGDEYISYGQYTIYFEKFNTANSGIEDAAANYTHQYMSNVQAQVNEAMSVHYAYKSNKQLDKLNFVFSIPVYKSMPSSYVTFPPVGDSVNTLSDLKVNDETVTKFDEDVIEYVKYIPEETTSVKITATPTSSKSTVSGTGTINITETETIINIIVTSETNEDKTYIVKLIKTPDSKMNVEDLITKLELTTSNDYLFFTTPKPQIATLLTNIQKQSASANVKITDSKDAEITSGTLKTTNKINITMFNGDNKTYTVVILGDTNADGVCDIVDLLRLQKHILKSITLTNSKFEAADVNQDDKVDILDLLRVKKYILGSIKTFK